MKKVPPTTPGGQLGAQARLASNRYVAEVRFRGRIDLLAALDRHGERLARVPATRGMGGHYERAFHLLQSPAARRAFNLARRYTRGTPYVPSPLLLGDRLYFTQGNNALLTVLDTNQGKPILDRVRLPGQTSFYASPVAAAGRVYLVDREGTTLVLKQSDKLEILATNHLDDGIDASPAIVTVMLFGKPPVKLLAHQF